MAKKQSKSSRRNRYNDNVQFLETALYNNGKAKQEGPKIKYWSEHDLRNVEPLNERQAEMFRCYAQESQICAHGSAGTGKAQPLHSKILTPSGWKLMKDMAVGTEVVTPSGEIANVIGIFPQGMKDIYTITFKDGAQTQCCAEHLWECNVPQDFWNKKGPQQTQVVNTQFIKEWLIERQNRPSASSNISINLIQPHETPHIEDLPMDPYMLGVLIGDGNFTTPRLALTSVDDHIIKRISQTESHDYHLVQNKHDTITFNISKKKRNSHEPNVYTSALQQLGIFGCKSQDKFIPDLYKQTSINQRLQLIKGLMDTDGTVEKTGGVVFSTSSKCLATDVQEIMWSLGAKCKISCYETTYLPRYDVRIGYAFPRDLFSLPRKQQLCSVEYDSKQLVRQIVSVERTSSELAQCIMINHSDHLYITDDYIITHNTFLGCYLAIRDVINKSTDQRKIIIVRSAVPTREVGHLPGTLDEKMEQYELPYKEIMSELFAKNSTYDDMKSCGLIEFMSTSFIRGLTWDDAIVIVDEAQNMSLHEINSVMTRIGTNSRVILLGDTAQADLTKKHDMSGFAQTIRVVTNMKSFATVEFMPSDIVRSEFVKEWIIAFNNYS